MNIRNILQRTIGLEAEAINQLKNLVDESFERSVQLIADSKGRLVISGIGKSAIIAQKIVATLNSTGTPAIFLHAADAIHGDIGMIQHDDVVMIISKSGSSPEIKVLVPLIRNFGNKIIAMTGNMESYLAKQSDVLINTTVEVEACPNNLAPTTSTTAQLVAGDALAVALMEIKGFKSDDFAKFHPGGTLGKKLYLRVADLYTTNERPFVNAASSLRDVIVEMTAKRLGVTAVLDKNNELAGVITDGDLRRMLEKSITLDEINAAAIMTSNPKKIAPDALAVDALDVMRKNNITQLLVAEGQEYLGIIHLHDLIKEGLI